MQFEGRWNNVCYKRSSTRDGNQPDDADELLRLGINSENQIGRNDSTESAMSLGACR